MDKIGWCCSIQSPKTTTISAGIWTFHRFFPRSGRFRLAAQRRGSQRPVLPLFFHCSEANLGPKKNLPVDGDTVPMAAGPGSGVSMPAGGFTASPHGFQHELGRTEETGAVSEMVNVASTSRGCRISMDIKPLVVGWRYFTDLVQPSSYAPTDGLRLCLPISSQSKKDCDKNHREYSEFWRNLLICSCSSFDSNPFGTIMGFNGKAVTRGFLQIPFRSL